jgi:hypothetical protein
MRIRAQFISVAVVLFTAPTWRAHADDADDATVRKSVVKIFATQRRPDVFPPWSKEISKGYKSQYSHAGQSGTGRIRVKPSSLAS